MNCPRLLYIVPIFLLIALSTSCQPEEDANNINQVKTKDIELVDLFIDFEQNGMVQPVSIEFIGEDRLAILDSKLKEVFLFNTDAGFQRRFGREGKGILICQ